MAARSHTDAVAAAVEAGHLLELTHTIGARLRLHKYGATVVSFTTSGGQDILFAASRAKYDGSKPVRAGIPIVFPQFGTSGPLPQHGFARNSWWTVESTGDGAAELSLKSTPDTLAVWPHAFELRYRVHFDDDKLVTALDVINPAGAPDAFQFEALLHTYLAIGKDNIEGVRIAGLAGTQYIDKMDAGATHDEAGAEVRITRETDRVYMAAPADVEVTGIVAQARAPVTRIIVHKTGTVRDAHMALRGVVVSAPLDVVVWNAWVDKCASIADFDPADFKSYVCIEPGRVSERTAHYAGRESLPPGKKFTLSQMLVLKREDAPATA